CARYGYYYGSRDYW
nr:immunoglobulin heavy chain junction region [Mus musculus]MBK4196367.1 immunoglobulin heavy chain junction region [Mus musculus]